MVAPQAYAHFSRNDLLDYVNRLVMFDQTGKDCETAMSLMKWNTVTADELNTRRANPKRRHYLPVR